MWRNQRLWIVSFGVIIFVIPTLLQAQETSHPQRSHPPSVNYSRGVYEVKMEGDLLEDVFKEIEQTSDVEIIIIGDARVPLTTTVRENSLAMLIRLLAWRANFSEYVPEPGKGSIKGLTVPPNVQANIQTFVDLFAIKGAAAPASQQPSGGAQQETAPDLGQVIADGNNPSAVSDANDIIHVYYDRGGKIYHRRYSGGMWSPQETLVCEGNHPLVKIGPDGKLHLLYTRQVSTTSPNIKVRRLFYRWSVPNGSWSEEVQVYDPDEQEISGMFRGDFISVSHEYDLDIAPDGTVFVVYRNEDNLAVNKQTYADVYLVTKENGQWQSRVNLSQTVCNFPPDKPGYTSQNDERFPKVVFYNGTLFIAFNKAGDLWFLRRTGDKWQSSKLEMSGNQTYSLKQMTYDDIRKQLVLCFITYYSVAIYHSNKVSMGYYSPNNGNWTVENVAEVTTSNQFLIPEGAVYDSQGKTYVFYTQTKDPDKTSGIVEPYLDWKKLLLKVKSGNNWSNPTQISIYDPDGQPDDVWFENGGDDTFYGTAIVPTPSGVFIFYHKQGKIYFYKR